MTAFPTRTLNTGAEIPAIGLGVWQLSEEEARSTVRFALGTAGYPMIDTAAGYENERGVGRGIAESGRARDDVFIVTKLNNPDHGYDRALRAIDQSLENLQLDAVDLFLIHWPLLDDDRLLDTWRAFERIQADGRAKAIGVSNFEERHLRLLADAGLTTPAVDQVELHPGFPQTSLRRAASEAGIVVTSWSPLGGTSGSGWGPRSKPNTVLTDPVIGAIAKAHGKSPAQVVIRWHLQNGLVVIPKSTSEARIAENIDVFDFELSDVELASISALTEPGRIGADPNTANFGAPA
ncbi:aldo/keto reductase [Plantibacter sp. YIM 135249]|uniref:aldo/keto reductase n=1 Tax=Plantibacter sp. YIM 135249 TaxID=3423918 RepID=UPI003D330670